MSKTNILFYEISEPCFDYCSSAVPTWAPLTLCKLYNPRALSVTEMSLSTDILCPLSVDELIYISTNQLHVDALSCVSTDKLNQLFVDTHGYQLKSSGTSVDELLLLAVDDLHFSYPLILNFT